MGQSGPDSLMSSARDDAGNRDEDKPVLRHEFVGMMFAITVGEIAVNLYNLIALGNISYHLPAYSHLLLCMCVVATSWVGWTQSLSPGARRDVKRSLEPEFIILLIDVLLVIEYYLLVKYVDVQTDEGITRYNPSILPESILIIVIFCTFFVWDFFTKCVVSDKANPEKWWPNLALRILVTLVCVGLAFITFYFIHSAKGIGIVYADFALIALVFLFRAAKDLVSAYYPSVRGGRRQASVVTIDPCEAKIAKILAVSWTSLFLFALAVLCFLSQQRGSIGFVTQHIASQSSPGATEPKAVQKMRIIKVYIAGPYSKGDVAINVRNAIAAGDRLYEAGFVPFIPHFTHFWHMLFPKEYERWLEYDNYWLPDCDCVLRLPGESGGADKEVDFARKLGKRIFMSEDDLRAAYPEVHPIHETDSLTH